MNFCRSLGNPFLAKQISCPTGNNSSKKETPALRSSKMKRDYSDRNSLWGHHRKYVINSPSRDGLSPSTFSYPFIVVRWTLYATMDRAANLMPAQRCHSSMHGSLTGSVKINLLPLPTSLSTQIRPPWASTRPLVIYRPSPNPS